MAFLRASWPFARQSLAGRRGRTILLVVAVMVASALVVATSCGLASVERSVEVGLANALGATDARVVHRYAQPFDASLLEEIRGLPEVEAATGRNVGSLTLVRADGAADAEGRPLRVTVQARGVDVPEDPRFREIEIEHGRRPARDSEILLDPASASVLKAKVGDTVRVQRFGPPLDLEVVGTYRRPRLGALQRPLVEVSRSTLAAATGGGDETTSILILLAKGADVPAWCAAHADLVEEPLILEPADRVKSGFDRQLLASRLGFTLAASIAFLSCAFIVAVGLTTAVTEQSREMAIARCIGAARGQLFAAQVMVGCIVAGGGGLLGIPLGIGLAAILVDQWRAFLPGGMAISPLGSFLAFLGALAAGVAGAAFPAWQASRVTPLAALAVRSRPARPGGLRLCIALAAACVGLQLLLMLLPDTQARFWAYAVVGIAALHIGAFLAAPAVLVALTALLARPVEWLLGVPRGLLAGSIRSMPYRLGFTAGALMVGTSVLVSTHSGGLALYEQVSDRLRFGDAFIMRSTGISPSEQAAIARQPGVLAACPVGFLPVRLAKGETLGVDGLGPPNVIALGFEPRSFFELNRVEWLRGSLESALPKLLDGTGVLIAEQFHRARGLDIGDTIGLGGKEGDIRFEIVGVVTSAGLDLAVQFFGLRQVYMEIAAGAVFLDFGAIEKHFGSRNAGLVQLILDPKAGSELETNLGRFVEDELPGAAFASGRSMRATMDEVMSAMLGITRGISFAALLLACFGVGNVVAAGIGARRLEFGVMLAVGGGRFVPPRLVLAETLLVGLAASVVGTGLGLHLAAMGTHWHLHLAGIPSRLVVPWESMSLGWAATVALAMLAALPAAIALLRESPRALLAARS